MKKNTTVSGAQKILDNSLFGINPSSYSTWKGAIDSLYRTKEEMQKEIKANNFDVELRKILRGKEKE